MAGGNLQRKQVTPFIEDVHGGLQGNQKVPVDADRLTSAELYKNSVDDIEKDVGSLDVKLEGMKKHRPVTRS